MNHPNWERGREASRMPVHHGAKRRNRAEDGIDLRYRFGYEHRYENPMIATYLDRRPSSVLEMPVALSMRCKESIMDDPDACDRTGRCLWNMIANLGLGSLNDRAHRRLYS
ncbi:MAG: hypothetical protein LBU32_26995 [Clostridiales bacterium]|nr:hypothetical protein [Clostridiales bacterium]